MPKLFFDNNIILEKQKTTCNLIIGKFQPFHIGHYQMIKDVDHLVMVIITGKRNKNRPFDISHRMNWINETLTTRPYFILLEHGYIPYVVNETRKHFLEPESIICGLDREQKYSNIIAHHNSIVTENKRIDAVVRCVNPETRISATQVRKTITDNNYKEFVKLMPEQLHLYFEEMKHLMKGF